jgi:S1-C subfamily serine protease
MSLHLRSRTLCTLLLGVACLLTPRFARADAQLDVAVLKKVKAATVHLEVLLPGGDMAEGSGFFTEEAGVILTNAHVLGMLDADGRPPQKIIVTVDSGEPTSRAFPARLLGLDRGSDLAVLRVEGKDLPAPLKVAPAKNLTETQEVFIFGFPLGKKLGKNITVSKSSVSSLRKEGANLKQIQVNGGMHPGNSGGPVIDGTGQVVGVSVSVITGTQLHFAIPGESVQTFLNGRIQEIGADLAYRDGDKVKMAFRIVTIDPLSRIKKMSVETWNGEPGTRRRPPSAVAPPPLPGDTDRQVIDVKYDSKVMTSIELSFPAAENPKSVCWIRPTFVNATGQQRWYGGWAPNLGTPVERKEIPIGYKPRLNRVQLTELISEGSFRFQIGTEEHSLAVNSKSLLNERTAAQKSGESVPVHLDYRSFSIALLEDKKPIQAGEEFKKLINDIRFMNADVEMEADGNTGKAKADLTKVPRASRDFLTDVSDQVLQSLELVSVPLPQGSLKPLQSWKVQRTVLIGSTVFGGVQASSDIKYTYLGTRKIGARDIAFLNIAGTIKGLRGNGLNVGGNVTGATQIALDTGEVLTATMNFKADADLEIKKTKAKLIGTLMVRLRRDIPAPTMPPK